MDQLLSFYKSCNTKIDTLIGYKKWWINQQDNEIFLILVMANGLFAQVLDLTNVASNTSN